MKCSTAMPLVNRQPDMGHNHWQRQRWADNQRPLRSARWAGSNPALCSCHGSRRTHAIDRQEKPTGPPVWLAAAAVVTQVHVIEVPGIYSVRSRRVTSGGGDKMPASAADKERDDVDSFQESVPPLIE